MQLFNADGSRSEISGNGVRCLAAWIASTRSLEEGTFIDIETDAGVKALELLESAGWPLHVLRCDGTAGRDRASGPRCRRRARDGRHAARRQPAVRGARRRHGGSACTRSRRTLAVHPHFPDGTNVELATVEAPNRVRILIWERGVGPTEASGTGACAAAVAAMQFGNAARDVQVVSPGGTQRVEWDEDGLFLTGWAELVADSRLVEALMRSLHEAGEAVETYSPAEELFNRRRADVGLIGGPLALLVLLCGTDSDRRRRAPARRHPADDGDPLDHRGSAARGDGAHRAGAGDHPAGGAGADGVRAVRRSDHLSLHRQLHARRGDVRPWARPPDRVRRPVVARGRRQPHADSRSSIGAVATGISMWISNTATTAMMFPIGLSIVAHLTKGRESELASRNFATAMMLMAAFGASIGGMGTPIGTPPNLIGKGMLERIAHEHISFFQWMLARRAADGAPLRVPGRLFPLAAARGACKSICRRPAHIQEELRKLGPMSTGQRNTLIAFGATVALWLFPGVLAIVGFGDSALAQRLRGGSAGVGGGDDRRDPAVPAAGQLARPSLHVELGAGGPHRLGDHPALRRRPGDGRARFLDRARRVDRPRHHAPGCPCARRSRSPSSSRRWRS